MGAITFRSIPALAAGAALLAGCGAGADAGHAGDPAGTTRLPVVVDYSPTVSDVGALLYLAAHPRVDLRAVTLAGTGESRCAAALPNTLALLARAGRDDVPVACGRVEPIGPGHAWPPEWREAADTLAPLELGPSGATSEPSRSAVDLLADTAAATDGVVVVALGPLTNLADTIEQRPGLATDVKMVYSMGGALSVPGNAPGGEAEWNYYADPTAVDVVVRSELALTIVPLDATNYVPADHGLYRRLSDPGANPAERAVLDLWTAAIPWQSGFFLWDELTAVLAVDPSLAPVAPMRVAIVRAGPAAGATVATGDGLEVLVAGRPDRRGVEIEFLAGLAGGDRPGD